MVSRVTSNTSHLNSDWGPGGGPGGFGPGVPGSELGQASESSTGEEGSGASSREAQPEVGVVERDRADMAGPSDCCTRGVPGGSQSVDKSSSAERRFATCTRAAKELLDDVLRRLTELEWGEDDLFGVHLAVEEALMNAIKHGNALDASKEVHVRSELSNWRFWIQITDEGPGFNPEDVPDPTLDENLELPSGRGLMLMRTFMAKVEFNERGNKVTMEKHRSPSSE